MPKFFKTQMILLSFILLTFSANAQTISKTDTYVKIETNKGNLFFQLFDETPIHKKSFVKLAKQRFFNAYDFNRVIKGFVIQGGETDSAYAVMNKDPKKLVSYLLPEFKTNLFHQRGALAAGRDDNKEKKSFTGQFYVVDGKKYSDVQLDAIEKRIGIDFKFADSARKIYKEIGGTPHLDQNYTVFGHLVKGWDVLDKIASAHKDKADKPLSRISIKVSILNKLEIKKLLSSI